MYKALSLGWGVQSWTLAAMIALGELEMIDAAIHSDTTYERESTRAFRREWTPFLEAMGLQVSTVSNLNARGTLVAINGNQTPLPAFTVMDGKQGQIRRQCTGEWKIGPIKRFLQAHRNKQQVELWMGISFDEFHRAKAADVKYITHRYPLLEMRMSRQDCLDWLEVHDLPSPGKSSCVFCPFANKAAWEDMKRRGGEDWQVAVDVDAQIRDLRPPGQLFVHRNRVPLEQAVIVPEWEKLPDPIELLASDDGDAECDSGYCFL